MKNPPPPAKPLAVLELEGKIDELCGNPLCPINHHYSLEPDCHLGAGCDVAYFKGTGVLTVSCHQCQKLVAEVRIALISV